MAAKKAQSVPPSAAAKAAPVKAEASKKATAVEAAAKKRAAPGKAAPPQKATPPKKPVAKKAAAAKAPEPARPAERKKAPPAKAPAAKVPAAKAPVARAPAPKAPAAKKPAPTKAPTPTPAEPKKAKPPPKSEPERVMAAREAQEETPAAAKPPPPGAAAGKKKAAPKTARGASAARPGTSTAPETPPEFELPISEVELAPGYEPSPHEEYMNPLQLAYFRRKLLDWRDALLRESQQTIDHLRSDGASRYVGDEADRARDESEVALELRTRDRYRKLLPKIEAALRRIDDGSYGFCEETGEPIGLKRLEARPIATLSVEAQELREKSQRGYRDDA